MADIFSHLSLFACPVTGAALQAATREQLTALNHEIREGARVSRDGTRVPEELIDALVTADARFVYRVAEEVAWLLPDLAIIPASDAAVFERDKNSSNVREFYDELGWVRREDGLFEDTAQFTEVGAVADSYRVACNQRIGRWLSGGKYLLDVASGAVPHPEYLDFSEGYEFRICVDFSIRALREARRRLGDKALCVLGDITCLPLRDNSVDAVVSLHTIYHVPTERQTTAVHEVVRVTKPAGRVVIVYTWRESAAMKAVFKVRSALGRWRRLGRPSPAALRTRGAPDQHAEQAQLYFAPQSADWFDREIKIRYSAKLRVWSLVNTFFQQRFFRSRLSGSFVAKIVETAEAVAPGWCGRHGQYPMFVIEKRQAG